MDLNNPHASPIQTIIGKGTPNPLKAEGLPKTLKSTSDTRRCLVFSQEKDEVYVFNIVALKELTLLA